MGLLSASELNPKITFIISSDALVSESVVEVLDGGEEAEEDSGADANVPGLVRVKLVN